MHHLIFIGRKNQEKFVQFLQACAETLHVEKTYVIFNGAPPHHQAESPADHIHLQMLPPYSPFHNVVEEAISSLKDALKNDICRPEVQQQMPNRQRAQEQNISLGECRKRILVAAAERNLGALTVAKCAAWF